jgi:hypothetical protein
VRVGRELLRQHLADFPRLQAIVADRGYQGLAKLASRRQLKLDIKAKPAGTVGFMPIGPLWRVEHAFGQLGPGAAWRAATRASRQAPRRGSRLRPWATYSAASDNPPKFSKSICGSNTSADSHTSALKRWWYSSIGCCDRRPTS